MLLLISQSSFKPKLTEVQNANEFWNLMPKLWKNNLLKKGDKSKLPITNKKIENKTIEDI